MSDSLSSTTGHDPTSRKTQRRPSSEVEDIICMEESETGSDVDVLQLRDAGFAWVVLGAMFVSNVLTFGYIRGFGIISGAILDEYPDSSGTMAGVLIGLLSGCRNIFAPVVGTLSNKIGLRISMCAGVGLNCAALIISYFCTTILQLSITLGVMIGFSQCILQCCQVVLFSQYFVKNLSLANGIRTASNPFGGIIYPFLVTALIQHFGLRFSFLILAAITSHIFICVLLMRPISLHAKIRAIERVNSIIKSRQYRVEHKDEEQDYLQTDDDANQAHLDPQQTSNQTFCNFDDNLFQRKRKLYHQLLNKTDFVQKEKPKKRLEFSFFKNIKYILFILLGTAVPLGMQFNYYMILYAKNEAKISPYHLTVLLAFEAVFDLLFRILYGWLNNKNLYKKSHALIVCLWCSGIGIFLIPFARDLGTLIPITALSSIGGAAYVTSLTVILCDEFGKEHISSTWGFIRTASGVFSFIDALIIGYILEATGSYTIPFFVMAFAMFLCGALVGLQSVVCKCFPWTSLA